MMKRLKSFEHGPTFVTLDSNNGEYIVNLYLNNRANEGINVIPDNQFKSTTLDACLEMYHLTCKQAIKETGK